MSDTPWSDDVEIPAEFVDAPPVEVLHFLVANGYAEI